MYALKVNPESERLEQIQSLEEDIAQSIEVILLTPKGAKIFEPEFGTNILKHLDRPIDEVVPLIIAEVWEALERWEPRIKVLSVDVVKADENGKILLVLLYEIKEERKKTKLSFLL